MRRKIMLGDKVKDKITGFSGIAVAYTEWLHGCARITIEPDRLDKDGKELEVASFDEERVVLVEDEPAYTPEEIKPEAPGGPRPSPTRGR